jgi:hypothetical protein
MSKTPKYYIGKYKSIEAFDVVLDFQEDNYNLGTAITYLLRAGKKPNNPISQDIKKPLLTFNENWSIKRISQQITLNTLSSTMHQQNTNPMEWHYYTNKATKRKIDYLLFEAAKLFANCESTYEARQQALKKEQEYLKQIHDLDPHFAERCGYHH